MCKHQFLFQVYFFHVSDQSTLVASVVMNSIAMFGFFLCVTVVRIIYGIYFKSPISPYCALHIHGKDIHAHPPCVGLWVKHFPKFSLFENFFLIG